MKQIFQEKHEIHSRDTQHNKQLSLVRLIDYLNEAAGNHSKSFGYPLKSLFKDGYSWILLSWNIKINKLPRLKEQINIETWISQAKRCFAYREFIIKDNHENIMAKASSQWIFYNIKMKKPARILPEFSNKEIIKPDKVCDQSILNDTITKQPFSKSTKKHFLIQKKDIDILNHVHNSKYIDWVLKAKPEDVKLQYKLRQLEIFYHHEIKYPGEVMIKQKIFPLTKNGELFIYDAIWDIEKNRLSSEIATKWQYSNHLDE
jgi:medium-chain acyl-[acyl-carrier-protein] hydrolase